MGSRRWGSAFVAALATTVSVLGAAPAHAVTAPLLPPAGTWFGAYVQPAGSWMKASVQASILQVETDLGRKLDIDHHYFPWGKALPGWQAGWDVANGRMPMTTWGDVDVAAVNAGTHDAYINERADAMEAVGAPIFLRWFPEMDADAKAAKARTPAQYVAAWRRIHGMFAARGASNVVWVWCPTTNGFDTGEAQTYYPGDAYVDWGCADGYNWAPGNPGAKWRSFAKIFAKFHDWGQARGKPLMVGETGTEEREPDDKAQWIAGAGDAVQTSLTGIRALVYFDAYASDFSGKMFDWRLDTSPSSYEAFIDVGREPFFRPLEYEEPDPDPPTDPEPDPTTEPDPDPPTDPEPDPTTEPDPEPDPTTEPDPEPDPTTEPEPSEEHDSATGAETAVDGPRFEPRVTVHGNAGGGKAKAPSSARTRLRPGRAGSFSVVLRNAGTEGDTLRLTAAPSGRRLRVRFLLDGRRVTGAVLGEGLALSALAAGEDQRLRLVVRVPPRLRRGVHRVRLMVASTADPSAEDDARAVIRVRP